MARAFVRASSNQIVTSVGSAPSASPLTMVSLCRKTGSDNTRMGIFRIGSAGNRNLAISTSVANRLVYAHNGTDMNATAMTLAIADGWVLVGVSKATGTVNARFHKYVFSTNTWTHENSAATLAEDTTTPTVSCWFGSEGSSSYFDGDIAACGIWNAALSDAQIESLSFSLSTWFQIAPLRIWMLDQQTTGQKVLDLTGSGANESSLVGTTVSTASVPVFSYGLPVQRGAKQPAAAVGGADGSKNLLLMGAG